MSMQSAAHKRPLSFTACVLMLLSGLLFQSQLFISNAAGLLVADGGFGGRLEIVDHRVDVTVNNGIAVTQIEQTFRNLENRQVEALYTFPVPEGASVSGFSMWINGEEMVGEVLEKQRAREIYNSYKVQRRDPGLLEQNDFKSFEMRIFPIAPKAEQRIRLTYYQELDVDHNMMTFVYPLATEPGKVTADTRVTGTFAFNANIRSEIPITTLNSPSHKDQLAIARFQPNYCLASIEIPEGSLSRDIVLNYDLKRPKTGLDVITSRMDREDGYFCMTFSLGEELEGENSGMDYVFVLDVSGSMGREGKMSLSTATIESFLDVLRADDRFTVMAVNVQPWLSSETLVAANDESRRAASGFLNVLQARGGTVLNPAISRAYAFASDDRPLNVVVLSDGMTEQSQRQELRSIIQQRPPTARVFCIGIGNDVERPLLQDMANETGGLAAFLSRGDNLERAAQAFRRKLTRPAATNVSFEMDGSVYDVEGDAARTLYHGAPIRLYGRYHKAGTVPVTITADIQGRTFSDKVEVELPEKAESQPEIERMWAWHRMGRMQRELDHGGPDKLRNEIVRLGEAFSIAGEHTSFLVLENNAEFQRWKIERRNVLRIANDRRAQERLREQLADLRNQTTNGLGPEAVRRKSDDPVRAIPQASNNQPIATPQTNQSPGDVNWPSRRSNGGGDVGVIGTLFMLLGLALVPKFRKKRQS